MATATAPQVASTLTPDDEQRLARMAERASTRQGDHWADLLDVVAILSRHAPKSRIRGAAKRVVAEQTQYLPRTQERMVQLFALSCDPQTGEPYLPTRLHWSTALYLAEKGADHALLMQANDQSWTMQDARDWAGGLTAKTVEEPPTVLDVLKERASGALKAEAGDLAALRALAQALHDVIQAAIR